MTEASMSELEHFLMTKFRTATPPTQYTMNGNVDLTVESNGYDSHNNTLKMHTFRPYDGNSNNAYGSAPMSSTSSVHWATNVTPSSTYRATTIAYESDAYRPNGALYQNVFYPTARNGNSIPSTYMGMKSPIPAGTYGALLSPQDALNHIDNARCDFMRNMSPYRQSKKHVYTYEEADIIMRLSNSNERVGFSMAGGADENRETVINSVLLGGNLDLNSAP